MVWELQAASRALPSDIAYNRADTIGAGKGGAAASERSCHKEKTNDRPTD